MYVYIYTVHSKVPGLIHRPYDTEIILIYDNKLLRSRLPIKYNALSECAGP